MIKTLGLYFFSGLPSPISRRLEAPPRGLNLWKKFPVFSGPLSLGEVEKEELDRKNAYTLTMQDLEAQTAQAKQEGPPAPAHSSTGTR